jgi:hypothetical protein
MRILLHIVMTQNQGELRPFVKSVSSRLFFVSDDVHSVRQSSDLFQ